jgi:hypothetical protein
LGEVAKLHDMPPQSYHCGFAIDAARITTVRLPADRRYTQVIKKTAATNRERAYQLGGTLAATLME